MITPYHGVVGRLGRSSSAVSQPDYVRLAVVVFIHVHFGPIVLVELGSRLRVPQDDQCLAAVLPRRRRPCQQHVLQGRYSVHHLWQVAFSKLNAEVPCSSPSSHGRAALAQWPSSIVLKAATTTSKELMDMENRAGKA